MDAILPTGGSWIIEAEVEGQTLFLTTTTQPDFGAGDALQISVPPVALHVFDEGGARLEEVDRALGDLAA